MNFRAIDEPPFAAPRSGVPRRLLGFVTFSLLLHSLLFIAGNDATPLNISQLGNPYIHAILSTEPATNNNPTTNTDRPSEKPSAAEIRKIAHDAAKPDKLKTADKQRKITGIRETPASSPVETKTREPLNTSNSRTKTPPETAATTANDRYDASQQALSATKSATKKSTHTNTQGTTQTDTATQRNYLLGQLQNQLSRYLTYPLRARRRGWQGEVLLSLRLDAQGQLHNIQILRSSSYAVLDRAALQALSRLGRLRLPADAPQRQPVDLQLPVVYRLSEG